MPRRKTHEDFIKEMNIKKPNIKILGEYINACTKIKCKCLIDGCEWEAMPSMVLTKTGCPKCGIISSTNNSKIKRRKSHSQFIEEAKYKNPNIEILTEYINKRTKVKCRCKIDGYEWEANPSDIIKGCRCPKCFHIFRVSKQKKTPEKFNEQIKEIHPNIELLSKYINNRTKVKCRCRVDGYEWEAKPGNLLNGCGCYECGIKKISDKNRKTNLEIKEDMKRIDKNIEIISGYKSSKTKVKCRCKIDGYEWETEFYSLVKRGYGCPKCNSFISKGEIKIEKYCSENYLKYKRQYKIKGCKNRNKLPFDFALFDKNKLIALVEYQGKQHYKPIKHFGGEKTFKEQQKRDEIKREYCKANDIKLIEIPYWEKDIETFIDERLNNIGHNIQLSII